MRLKLIFILCFGCWILALHAQIRKSPHGDHMKIACTTCHTTQGWHQIKRNGFNHNRTKFPLTGQHRMIACQQCHTSLKFEEAKTDCRSCHIDIHEGTVGQDCASCHNTNSWIVNNSKIRRIHQEQGFPLLGAHAISDCRYCHKSASSLKFENIRTDCYSCHSAQYNSTTAPNHIKAGFGTNCAECHKINGLDWSADSFDHNAFFPLTGAHRTIACSACHWDNYNKDENLSVECSSCHGLSAAQSQASPAHATKFKSFSCGTCHNTISWSGGISFRQHDPIYGRIYSGVHRGVWTSCTDCHTNNSAYTATCNKCHNFNSGVLP